MNQNNQATRVPVIDLKGKPLMPTTAARARKWIKSGKAVGRRNKLGVFYVQLNQKPSGYETQTLFGGNRQREVFYWYCFSN